MVNTAFDDKFKKIFLKIKDNSIKQRIIKQISRLKENPELGKPMQFARKGTREVHIPPFRLSYVYIKKKKIIVFLDFYHKNKQ